MGLTNLLAIAFILLVVSIVILIILAGISIMGITQTRIFDKAKLAKAKYENAQKKEQEFLNKLIHNNNLQKETESQEQSVLNDIKSVGLSNI